MTAIVVATLTAGFLWLLVGLGDRLAQERRWRGRPGLAGVGPGGPVRAQGMLGRTVADLAWRAGWERPAGWRYLAWIVCPLPLLAVSWTRARNRLVRLREQLPDGLAMLVEGLRIGQGLQGSWQTVALQWPDPLGREWRRVLADMELGLPWPEALADMARRTPLPEHDLLVRAVALQQRTGAPLAEVLERLAETMRVKAELEGDLAALTAQGRMSAWVLGLLPVGVAGLMGLVAPEHLGGFLAHPAGRRMALGALVAQGLAVLAMRRILRIEDR